jgi:hypothetical protein
MADGDGLYIEISPTGKKYWRFRRNKDGKRSWQGLGEYPRVSLREARELKNRAPDPAEPENKTPCALFSQVASEWADAHEQKLTNNKEKHNIRSRLNAHILPFISDMKIADLTATDILPLMQRLNNAGKHEI